MEDFTAKYNFGAHRHRTDICVCVCVCVCEEEREEEGSEGRSELLVQNLA